MSYPTNFSGVQQTWSCSGSLNITLASLANGAGREGTIASFYDPTYGLPDYIDYACFAQTTGNPTNGSGVEYYISQADTTSYSLDRPNPGGLSGVDAAVANVQEKKLQCDYLGFLAMSNGMGSGVQHQHMRIYTPLQYQIPLVVNMAGQPFNSASGNFRITATPYYRVF